MENFTLKTLHGKLYISITVICERTGLCIISASSERFITQTRDIWRERPYTIHGSEARVPHTPHP